MRVAPALVPLGCACGPFSAESFDFAGVDGWVESASVPVAAVDAGEFAGGVAEGDWGVLAVGVGVSLERVGRVLDGVDGGEALELRVVVAGSDVDESGGVVGAADEAAFAGPGGGCGAAAGSVGLQTRKGDPLW